MNIKFNRSRNLDKFGKDRMVRIVERLDARYFNRYFSDKDLEIRVGRDSIITYFKKMGMDTSATCCEDFSITINPKVFAVCSYEEIKDVIFHEMIHLFVFANYRFGRRWWGEESKVFVQLCEDFDCPIAGRDLNKIYATHFKMCFSCGEVYPKKFVECSACGSKRLKTYRNF